jgi:ribosomal protein S18 acetylase RimI-like enzyme
MPDEIRIRRAEPGDEARLASLCAVVQELHARHRPDVFKPMDIAGLELWFEHALATATSRFWLAEIGEAAVGYVLVVEQRRADGVFCYQRRWLEIDQVGVDPGFRRRGVARALIGHVCQTARDEGVADVELNTWSFNDAAQLTFQRLGFNTANVRFSNRVKTA